MSNTKRPTGYSDSAKVEAITLLRETSWDFNDVHRQTGIPVNKLVSWSKTLQRNTPADILKRELLAIDTDTSSRLADKYEQLTNDLLNHALRPEAIVALSAKDAIMSAAIATDKARLLRDKATSIQPAEMSDGLFNVINAVVTLANQQNATLRSSFERFIAHPIAQRRFSATDIKMLDAEITKREHQDKALAESEQAVLAENEREQIKEARRKLEEQDIASIDIDIVNIN